STGLGSITCPRGGSPPTPPGPRSRSWPTTRARWTARIGLDAGDHHHQDAPSAPVRARRPAHPLGPASHAPPAGALAVGDRLDGSAGTVPNDPTPGAHDHSLLRGWRRRGKKSAPAAPRDRTSHLRLSVEFGSAPWAVPHAGCIVGPSNEPLALV